jgi:hypothetical protein
MGFFRAGAALAATFTVHGHSELEWRGATVLASMVLDGWHETASKGLGKGKKETTMYQHKILHSILSKQIHLDKVTVVDWI